MHHILSRASYRSAVRATTTTLNGGAASGNRSKALPSLLQLGKLSVGGRRSVYSWRRTPTLTKIVATIGPVSEDFEPLQQVVDAGMRVMRINFSHATFEEAEKRLTNLRACKGKHAKACLGEHNLRAVLLDTQGPEIRTGNVEGGGKIELVQGSTMELTTNPDHREVGTAEKLFVSYRGLTGAVTAGSAILLDDGQVSLRVTDVREESVTCLVENSGTLKSRRGVNLPGAHVDLPALSEKDKIDISYGIQNDVDFVAASFVRKAEDVRSIRRFIEDIHSKFWPADHPTARIISKIENLEAVDNFDEILELSDGIMVARGDLGVEIPAQQVTNLQKKMVRACNRVGKPVIVATQMLESMQTNPRPTRAEVSDVTNAVYDGADAVMLSGESAQGKYPVESVEMMRCIIDEAESWKVSNPELVLPDEPEASMTSEMEGIASAAVHAAHSLKAKLIVVVTKKGHLARLVAKFRPNVPVMASCPDRKVGRQLILHRGLHPLVLDPPGPPGKQPLDAVNMAKCAGFCQAGDTIIVAYRDYDSPAKDLALKIITVRD
uniref:Pyruvate kinase n=1 Tax=Saccharina japonica TaxID=88149 RepID=A0A097IU92_SACJA|nr:pyruvate kinase [Saccharina japonica]AIW62933.1 pyruvate kinase [Saccharina japonica]